MNPGYGGNKELYEERKQRRESEIEKSVKSDWILQSAEYHILTGWKVNMILRGVANLEGESPEGSAIEDAINDALSDIRGEE